MSIERIFSVLCALSFMAWVVFAVYGMQKEMWIANGIMFITWFGWVFFKR